MRLTIQNIPSEIAQPHILVTNVVLQVHLLASGEVCNTFHKCFVSI